MGNRNYYGILGSGDINKKIVTDGLLDVNGDDVTFLIHARRKPQGAVESVYDFLADNEATFVVYTRVDDNAPKALLGMANGVNTIDDPTKAIIGALEKNKGTLLLLWNETNPEESERIAVMAANAGVEMKDLSDGLAPIIVDNAPKVEKEQPETEEEETEVSVVPFSRDELLNMSMSVLRRQAKSLGKEDVGRISKEELVSLILGEKLDTIEDDDEMSEEEWNSTVGNGVLIWTHTEEGHGDIATRDITPEEVIKILELLGKVKY